ncbi:MAG: hypothetical protein L0177_12085 [Chloroflexi bacterium]|nr:hypothetical protein [Chloroflexota bacterium]
MLKPEVRDSENVRRLKADLDEAEAAYRRLENLLVGIPGQVLVVRRWEPGDYRRLHDAERRRDEARRLYCEAAGIPA